MVLPPEAVDLIPVAIALFAEAVAPSPVATAAFPLAVVLNKTAPVVASKNAPPTAMELTPEAFD